MRTIKRTSHLRWPSAPGHTLNNEQGVALLVTLFVVAIVTILVLEYHFDATVELDLAINYSEDVQAYHLAMAGVHFARAVLQQDDASSDGAGDIWFQVGLIPACISPQQLLGLGTTIGENAALSTGGISTALTSAQEAEQSVAGDKTEKRDVGCVNLRIVDESRKLPLNALWSGGLGPHASSDENWVRVFERFFDSFGIAPETVEALVDWLDPDDEPLGVGGAEDTYYEGLKTPYKARNGPIFSPGEIRLIRGFDAATIARLFPGVVEAAGADPDKPEVAEAAVADLDMGNNPYFTPYGGEATALSPPGSQTPPDSQNPPRSGARNPRQPPQGAGTQGNARVNLNTAPPEVLAALFAGLLDLSQESVNDIISDLIARREEKAREEQHFKTSTEVFSVITDSDLRNRLTQVADIRSTHFRVESTGKVGDITKRVVAIFKREGRTPSMLSFKIE